MDIVKWTRRTSQGFYLITNSVVWIGSIATAGIVLIVFVDVCGRYFLNKPLQGAYELVEQGMGVLGGFAIMYAAVKQGHVAIDLVPRRFSRRTQMIMQSTFSFLGFGTWAVVAYEVCAVRLVRALEISEATAGIPPISVVPALLMLVLGVFLCSLTLLIQTFHPIGPGEVGEPKE